MVTIQSVWCLLRRYDQALVRDVQQRGVPGRGAAAGLGPRGRWFVLLDAAKAAACRPPDLSAAPADFVVRCCPKP